MLLRLAVENISSFKDAVEFNTFPSSKSHSHENHKIVCGHTNILRLSAIYGANGAGKSNLLSALSLLKNLIIDGSLSNVSISDHLQFKFDHAYIQQPSAIAVEFFTGEDALYYHIEFDRTRIHHEELLLSKKSSDVEVFRREEGKLSISQRFMVHQLTDQFRDVVERMLRPDMPLLSFFGKYYPMESATMQAAYNWFAEKLEVVLPDATANAIPHMLDKMPEFAKLANNTIAELNTGIMNLKVKKEIVTEESAKEHPELLQSIVRAKQHPDQPQILVLNDETFNIVAEDKVVYKKLLVSVHQTLNGQMIEMPLSAESDGTRRMIEYMPLFFAVNHQGKVFLVDEIERSMHPILIKDLVRKLSSSETTRGQLIFTTHESSLLDQSIFRPDEIWFAQKDVEQATQLYPLSDFNIHKTANIENGYLAGRFGGIPFLSNLKDLNW